MLLIFILPFVLMVWSFIAAIGRIDSEALIFIGCVSIVPGIMYYIRKESQPFCSGCGRRVIPAAAIGVMRDDPRVLEDE